MAYIICTFDTCTQRGIRHGLCNGHSAQLYKGQELRPLRQRRKNPSAHCTFGDCGGVVVARELCSRHYRQSVSGEAPTKLECEYPGCSGHIAPSSHSRCAMHETSCIIAPCAKTTIRAGGANSVMCGMHYQRHRNGSDMLQPPKADGPQWRVNSQGYVYRARTVDGKRRGEWQHREMMAEHLGRKLYAHENVHHVNGDRADNRLENLELWSTSQPPGQRVPDKVAWARELLALYGDEFPEDQPERSTPWHDTSVTTAA